MSSKFEKIQSQKHQEREKEKRVLGEIKKQMHSLKKQSRAFSPKN